MVKKPTKNATKNDNESFFPVGIVFFTIGIALGVGESTRLSGIPFLVLGITFFAISAAAKRKKTK